MKKLAISSFVILAFAAKVFGAEISGIRWDQAHIDQLRGIKKPAVAQFINANLPADWMQVPPYGVSESGWARSGDEQYDFLVLLDISGRGYSNTLLIYTQRNIRVVKSQEIDGWKMGNLPQMVKDLDSDGRDELIVPTELGPRGSWFPLMQMPVWPAVYRLEKGKYVDASRDFVSFYDSQILPKLDEQILQAKGKISEEPSNPQTLGILQMERNKILRVINRDPSAGLKQAYVWMNSGDAQLLQCAIETFTDIGGHEKELRDSQQALPLAVKREMAARKSNG